MIANDGPMAQGEPKRASAGVAAGMCTLVLEFELSALGNVHRAWCMKCCPRQSQHIVWFADVSIANAMAICSDTPRCVIRRRVEANVMTVCVVVRRSIYARQFVQAFSPAAPNSCESLVHKGVRRFEHQKMQGSCSLGVRSCRSLSTVVIIPSLRYLFYTSTCVRSKFMLLSELCQTFCCIWGFFAHDLQKEPQTHLRGQFSRQLVSDMAVWAYPPPPPANSVDCS